MFYRHSLFIEAAVRGVSLLLVVSVALCTGTVCYAAHKTMFVASEKLYLLNLPSARGTALPGIVLWKNDKVDVVQEKGLWAKISPVDKNVEGWVRIFTLMELADPGHKRRETEHKRRNIAGAGDILFGEKDTSEYSSAAAARGISAFGRVMRDNGAVSMADTKNADIVTEYSISSHEPGDSRKAEMKKLVDTFLKEGGLGVYMDAR